MQAIFPKQLQTKTGESLIIRLAQIEDAANMIAFANAVGGESDFLTFGVGEFNKTIAEEEALLTSFLETSNQLFILAEIADEIVGMLDVHASQKTRLQHIGECGISVRQIHWGKGIASHMMSSMLEWAKASGIIRKINLSVLTTNESAIKLYQKFGFEQEGLIRRDGYLHGRFNDTYCMGVLID